MTTQKTVRKSTKSKSKSKAKSRAEDDANDELEKTPCQLAGSNCHWKIASPNGPESMGTCKKCGTQRPFKNSFEYSSWYGAKAGAKGRRGRPRKTS